MINTAVNFKRELQELRTGLGDTPRHCVIRFSYSTDGRVDRQVKAKLVIVLESIIVI